MDRYKLLRDCQDGEWVYYEVGRLCQVQDHVNSIDGRVYKDLVTGYIRIGASKNTIVYPLTIHNKVVAEAVYRFYTLMHEKRLINGSKWVNWLSDKYDELMALSCNAEREDYIKIYDSIEAQIRELEYYKSLL